MPLYLLIIRTRFKMNKLAFKQILQRYIDGTSTEEEIRLIDQWYELLDNDLPMPQTAQEWKEIEDRLWAKINHIDTTPKSVFNWNSFIKYGIAASVVFLLGVYWLVNFTNMGSGKIPDLAGYTKKYNDTKNDLELHLSDGSRVVLSPKSQLLYPENFAEDKREVYLNGEAFFDIAKNAEKPFFVYYKDVITKVLGTSFIIKPSTKNSAVEVEVLSGKVTVYKNKSLEAEKITNSGNGVLLTPNQKVTYFQEEEHFITGLVENPVILKEKPADYNFNFDDLSLSEAIVILENAYGIEIELDTENLGNCKLTGDLASLSMYSKLDIICQSIGATYQVKGTSILISGTGCQ